MHPAHSFQPQWQLVFARAVNSDEGDGGNKEWILTAGLAIFTLQLLRSSVFLIAFVTALRSDNEQSTGTRNSAAHSTPPTNDTGNELERPLLDTSGEQQSSSPKPWAVRKIGVSFLGFALATYFLYFCFVERPALIWLLVFTTLTIAAEMVFIWLPSKAHLHQPMVVIRAFQLLVGLTAWITYAALRSHIPAATVLLVFFVVTTITGKVEDEATSESPKHQLSWEERWRLVRPYIWPDESIPTGGEASYTWWCGNSNRVRAISTWLCVIGSKVANIVAPLFLGMATTSLTHQEYRAAILYTIAYCFVSWVGTVLKELQSLLYLKVAQAAFVELASHSFAHLHSLSLDWHLRKQLGQVLRSMDRGIAACDTLMKYLFLFLIPAIAECVIVCAIFALYFSYLELGAAVFYFVFAYIVWTILVTLWRKKYRKALTRSDNVWHDKITDSLVNFETVKFFTAEDHELREFRSAVSNYQAGSVNVQGSLSFLNISQQCLLKSCLAVALALTAHSIQKRIDCCLAIAGCESPVSDCCRDTPLCSGMELGDFVTVLTYTTSLFAPLNFLGTVYNAIVMATIDLANMSELLAEHPDVNDAPDALELPLESDTDVAAVEFDNVYFHYPTQPEEKGLKGLTFQMKRGTTTAVVGPVSIWITMWTLLKERSLDLGPDWRRKNDGISTTLSIL